MTDEQKEQLQEIAENLYQIIKPIIDKIYEIAEEVANKLNSMYEWVKEFLTLKVSIKQKKRKKGRKYIHSYKKIELWKVIRGDCNDLFK